jgi:hypothetical protein
VGRHDHEFNFGLYCVFCGRSSGSSPERIVIANDPGYRVGGVFCILVGTVFPLCALAFGWFRDAGLPKFLTTYALALFALASGLIGFFMLIAESTIVFDLKARTVTLKTGFIFAPKIETLGFDQFRNFRLTSWQPPRQTTPTWFLDLIRQDGRQTRITTYSWESKMRSGVDSLTQGTGIPVDDQSGRLLP